MCIIYSSVWRSELLFHWVFCCSAYTKTIHFSMKEPKLSAGKRLTKPILFGTLLVGLASAFLNRWDKTPPLALTQRANLYSSVYKTIQIVCCTQYCAVWPCENEPWQNICGYIIIEHSRRISESEVMEQTVFDKWSVLNCRHLNDTKLQLFRISCRINACTVILFMIIIIVLPTRIETK